MGETSGRTVHVTKRQTGVSESWWELITVGPWSTDAALVSASLSVRGRSFVDACADSHVVEI